MKKVFFAIAIMLTLAMGACSNTSKNVDVDSVMTTDSIDVVDTINDSVASDTVVAE